MCVIAEFLGSFYADHVRFNRSQRSPHRASTDALISISLK